MKKGSVILFILAICTYCNAASQPDQNLDSQKQSLLKMAAKMLDLNPDKLGRTGPQTTSRSSNAATRYMQKLYFKHIQNPGPYEGSTVRSISPKLIASELENINDMSQLVFNLGSIPRSERVVRAELHFNKRTHRLKTLSPDYYQAKVLCPTCSSDTMIQLDRIPNHSNHWITFSTTDIVDDAVANNQTQLKAQFTRHDIPILAPKALRIHSPFLLVFTQQPGEQTFRRSKRSASYYQYLPVDEESTEEEERSVSNKDLNTDAVWRNNFERFKQVGPKLLKERLPKKSRKQRIDPTDPMMGFGRPEEPEKTRTNTVPRLVQDDLDVFLLGSEQENKGNKNQCGKREFVVNFRDIGWDEWIIAPKKFQAHYCAGGCEFPLSENSNPSNHAQLQSIAHSIGLLPSSAGVCCVPEKLDSQTLLYYDESGNVVLKNYPKMIVSTCACL